jgi:hypothetical protein
MKSLSFIAGGLRMKRLKFLCFRPSRSITPESLKRLEHEFSLREELDSGCPTDCHCPPLGPHSARFGGSRRNASLLSHPVDLACSLRLAIVLANAIGQLHQRHQARPTLFQVFLLCEGHQSAKPPSRGKATPVIKDASGEQR